METGVGHLSWKGSTAVGGKPLVARCKGAVGDVAVVVLGIGEVVVDVAAVVGAKVRKMSDTGAGWSRHRSFPKETDVGHLSWKELTPRVAQRRLDDDCAGGNNLSWETSKRIAAGGVRLGCL